MHAHTCGAVGAWQQHAQDPAGLAGLQAAVAGPRHTQVRPQHYAAAACRTDSCVCSSSSCSSSYLEDCETPVPVVRMRARL